MYYPTMLRPFARGFNLAWSGLNPDTLFVSTFVSYSFSLGFKFARFNFAQVIFPCSFFLVCLIELLTINAFIMSVFLSRNTTIFVKI